MAERYHHHVQVYSAPVHSASVNGVAFAPHELGLLLAAASSDGSLSVLAYQPDGTWAAQKARPAPAVLVRGRRASVRSCGRTS